MSRDRQLVSVPHCVHSLIWYGYEFADTSLFENMLTIRGIEIWHQERRSFDLNGIDRSFRAVCAPYPHLPYEPPRRSQPRGVDYEKAVSAPLLYANRGPGLMSEGMTVRAIEPIGHETWCYVLSLDPPNC